jgi:fused signal recognition particle receptor
MAIFNFGNLTDGLKRTREGIFGRIRQAISLSPVLNEELLSKIEETLVTGDVGLGTAEKLVSTLRQRAKGERLEAADQIMEVLKSELENLFRVDGIAKPESGGFEKPHVVMIVGVNGSGKTTSVGKLAHIYQRESNRVLIAAADTFRAASNEQLEVWAQRAGVRMVQQARGADPAAVAFDALKSATSQGDDVLIIDTAGRLHTRINLMEELKKVKRVIEKQMPSAPHEILLVIDATTGQNGLAQARQFTSALGVTGIILTKLDGTAKGGIVFAIADELKLPVRYVGVGEGIDDLHPFDKRAFVEALFARD